MCFVSAFVFYDIFFLFGPVVHKVPFFCLGMLLRFSSPGFSFPFVFQEIFPGLHQMDALFYIQLVKIQYAGLI